MTGSVASRSEVGLVRRRNEDALYVGTHLFAVADGLGGHIAGDIASRTAIEALAAYDSPVSPDHLQDHLGRAVAAADLAIRRRIARDPDLNGMGTTLVALLRSGQATALANVGDSRAYLTSGPAGSRRTVRITEDHTYEHLVSAAGRVKNLPAKLARFLDGRPDGRSADLTRLTAGPGDRVLLCSDGLSSYVQEGLIFRVIGTRGTAGEAVEHLVRLAMERGAPDNVTVLVLDL